MLVATWLHLKGKATRMKSILPPSQEDEIDSSSIAREIIDIDIDSHRTDFPSRRRRMQWTGLDWLFYESLPHVSSTCGKGMVALYQDSDLKAAYDAYDDAESIAFQNSCKDVPRDGLASNYDCDVQILPPTLIDNLERTCVAAGGNVQDFGGNTTLGIDCCGAASVNGNINLTYGYRTRDQRSCVAAAKCTADEASRFYQQGMFRAASQVFQDVLALVCGVGCDCGCSGRCPDQCPSTTTSSSSSAKLLPSSWPSVWKAILISLWMTFA
jgi:hypothetical protein